MTYRLKLLALLVVCGSSLAQRQPSRFLRRQSRPKSSIDYEIDYADLPALDGSLFAGEEVYGVLPRAPLEERQDKEFHPLQPGDGYLPETENNRPARNPSLDEAPKYNIPVQNPDRNADKPSAAGYQQSNLNLEEPLDIPAYLDYEYEDYELPAEPPARQDPEPARPALARSPIQEGPVYQIPAFKAPPPQYKPQGRPVNKPDRNYNPEFQNAIYDDELTEEQLLELEKEENEPDKLSLLLRETKFDCFDKGDGYYADDSLNCEVFHYCQDRVRHSWICPEYQIFHQVHLICMPQTDETACQESSNFYFVNDYLHQPITDESNKTVGYGHRYYPPGYTPGGGIDMANVEPAAPAYYENERPHRIRQPPRQSEYRPAPSEPGVGPQQFNNPPPRFRQQNPFGSAANQNPKYARPEQEVFYSPEDVHLSPSHGRDHDFQPPKHMKMQGFEDFVDIETILQKEEPLQS